METPLVTIVVRTCAGRAGMAREAVASVIAQTWRPLELIIAEDGGDSAATWLLGLATRGVEVRHLALSKAGRSAAGNAGLAAARGEFVGFLDDDDLFFPQHIELLARALLENPKQVAAYSTAVEAPTAIDDWTTPVYRERCRYVAHCRPYSHELLQRTNFLPIQSVLFRRSLFEVFGGFSLELDQLEDWDLWRRYSAAGDFQQVERVTSLYRVPATADVALDRHRRLRSYFRTLQNSAAQYSASRSSAGTAGRPFDRGAPSPMSTIGSALRTCLLSNRWLYCGYWHARQAYFSRRYRIETPTSGG